MSRTRSRRFSHPQTGSLIESLEGRTLLAADPLTVVVGGGAAKSVQFTDAGGAQAQVLVKGLGTASVAFEGTGLSQTANAKGLVVNGTGISLTSITVTGTNASSILQIITKARHALTIGTITAGGALNGLLAPSVTVTGDVTTGAGLHVLQLGGATGGTISVGSGRVGTLALQVGNVVDETLVSAIPITTFTAAQWVNTPGEDMGINVASQIKAISVAHDFSADVTTGSIGSMNVRGSLSNSTINLTTPLTPLGMNIGTLTVGGAIASTTINAGGNVGSIRAGRMADSAVYAGLVASPSGPLPSVTTDFRNTATIKSVTLKKSASASFSNSDIAAYDIIAANLGTVSQTNGGTPFGLAAHDVKTVSLVDLATGKTVRASNPPTTTAFNTALTAKGVTPVDFEVRIV